MKKQILICLLLSAVCALGGCSGKKTDAKPSSSASASPAATASASAETPVSSSPSATSEENAQATSAPTPVPPSTNKEVVSDDQAPEEIYWLPTNSDNMLTYHLKGCPQLEGKEAQKVNWEFVKTLGLRQCPECNPPQYEGYVDTE